MSNCDEVTTQHFDAARAAIMALTGKREVTSADIRALREVLEAGKAAGHDEIEALFALECAPNAKCPEWTEFFVETATDYIVWQARPTGVVNTPQAEWLLGQVDRARSVSALAVLMNVLAEAHRVPMWLAAAARGRTNAGWKGVAEALEAARQEMARAA